MHVIGSVTDPIVIQAMDDLSARLRGMIRGRPLSEELPNAGASAARARERRSCLQIEGNSYVDFLERLWFLENCVAPAETAALLTEAVCAQQEETEDQSEAEPEGGALPRPINCDETLPTQDGIQPSSLPNGDDEPDEKSQPRGLRDEDEPD